MAKCKAVKYLAARDVGITLAMAGGSLIGMAMMAPCAEAESYTLTNATDWPMMLQMVGLLKYMIGGLGLLVVGLGTAAWSDLRSGINAKCKTCSEGIQREHAALWDTLDTCCPREAANARDKKLRASYRGAK